MDIMARRAEGSAKRSFLRTGGHAGAAFAAGFIKTVTLGMVGSGFAQASMKLAPQMAHFGGALGVTLAGALAVKLASSLSALLPLALGGGLLAGPIAILVREGVKGLEELDKHGKKIDQLRAKYAEAEGKKAKKRIMDQLNAEEKIYAQLHKQQEGFIVLRARAKEFMHEISRPVAEPLQKAMKTIGYRLEDWGPRIRKALKPLAKELPGFIGGLMGGIDNFFSAIGKKMPSITKGFRQWGKELPGIGKALGNMVAAWIEDGPKVAEGVKDTARSFRDLAKAVGAVGKGFKGFNKINDQFVEFKEQARKTALEFRRAWMRAILPVLDIWGKFSAPARKAAADIRKQLNSTDKELDQTNRKLTKIANKKVITKLKADKHDAEAKIRDIDRKLQKTNDKRVISKLKADRRQAQAAIANINARLNALNGKTATTYIKTIYKGINKRNQGAPFHAAGGIIGGLGANHAAEGGPRGGRVWVGEQGPELVDLPFGSKVNSNPDSMAKAGRGGGSGPHLHFHFDRYTGSTTDLIKDLVNAKKRGQLDVLFR